MDADARQAMEIVRKADPDRYIATLYAPEDRRGALFAPDGAGGLCFPLAEILGTAARRS